jgi:DNA-binding CsgD family transcriptional regulator
MTAAGPAVDAALLETDGRIEFTHPLVRSAAYGSAPSDDRQRVHHALAEATDSERDPDRRAWHRARATSGPDEDVAADLERSAGRAQARGGVAAAAAFLERAAALSQDPTQRARRALAAAEAKELAGAPQSASTLLASALNGPLGERERALGERLKGQIALDLMHVRDAVPSLLEAADRLRAIEPGVARDTYLEAIRTAVICGRLGGDLIRRTAEAARDALPAIDPSEPYDALLAGMAVRYTDGYAAGADRLKGALDALRDRDGRREPSARWPGFARAVALDLFDDEACHALATRSVEVARERGALGALPLALDYLAILRSFEGDLRGATAALQESDAIADASGAARIGAAPLTLAGFRGDQAALLELVQATEREVHTGGAGTLLTYGEHALAVLLNGAGRYDAALEVGQRASDQDELVVSTWSLAEVIEAAARCGRSKVAGEALERLSERTQAAGTELALGIEARSRALLSEGSAADDLYREAVERLGRCRLVPDHARAHLTYGEWLRRAGRRVEARSQLRAAYERFVAMETEAFAERARRELVATGERVRKRTVETREQLTPQEAQIAQLASDGATNQEIGAQLYLSPRTVEWHLHKAYTKLGVASRRDLRDALERASAPSR